MTKKRNSNFYKEQAKNQRRMLYMLILSLMVFVVGISGFVTADSGIDSVKRKIKLGWLSVSVNLCMAFRLEIFT